MGLHRTEAYLRCSQINLKQLAVTRIGTAVYSSRFANKKPAIVQANRKSVEHGVSEEIQRGGLLPIAYSFAVGHSLLTSSVCQLFLKKPTTSKSQVKTVQTHAVFT